MNRKTIGLALLPGAMFISLMAVGAALGYRVNITQSLPLGLWKVTDQAAQGAYVEFCAPAQFAELVRERGYLPHGSCPQGLAPMLKPVAARAGDTVTIDAKGMAINGLQVIDGPLPTTDSKGRPLQPVAPGTYRIEPGTLWVLSTYNPRSLDSRYIGPIQADTVIAGMTPVFVFNQKENYALDRR